MFLFPPRRLSFIGGKEQRAKITFLFRNIMMPRCCFILPPPPLAAASAEAAEDSIGRQGVVGGYG